MQLRTSTKGALLATAVAIAFVATPVRAEDSKSKDRPAFVACLGANTCKGQSACKSFDHDCQAMNSCKGKGFIMTTEKECKEKGGKIIDAEDM
jgi:hypothetical protein